jgi:carboxymethylenebutenolidase
MAFVLSQTKRLSFEHLGSACFGDLDSSIPPSHVEQLRAAAQDSRQPTATVRYPDADHGFHCNERDTYDRPAALDAWNRTLDWFDTHLAAHN